MRTYTKIHSDRPCQRGKDMAQRTWWHVEGEEDENEETWELRVKKEDKEDWQKRMTRRRRCGKLGKGEHGEEREGEINSGIKGAAGDEEETGERESDTAWQPDASPSAWCAPGAWRGRRKRRVGRRVGRSGENAIVEARCHAGRSRAMRCDLPSPLVAFWRQSNDLHLPQASFLEVHSQQFAAGAFVYKE